MMVRCPNRRIVSAPTEHGNEQETLTQMLDYLRATAVIKAAGLTDEAARSRPIPASELSIAGLIKHLAGSSGSGSRSTSPVRPSRGRGPRTTPTAASGWRPATRSTR